MGGHSPATRIALAVVALVAAGCSGATVATTTMPTTPPSTTEADGPLALQAAIRDRWLLEEMLVDGVPYAFPVEHPRNDPAVDAPAYFEFSDEGRLSGGAPCNGFNGTYEFDGRRLTWDMTQEAFLCADRSWNQAEDLMFSVFSAEATVEISGAEMESLTLTGSSGHIVLRLRREPGPDPGMLFPDQAVLPVWVYVDGVVYDLGQEPAGAVLDLGDSWNPYPRPPVLTDEGLVMVTAGEAGEQTALTLYPTGGGDPVVLAEAVGSFALSEDRQRIAWAEPWQGPSGNARETTRLVEAEFPSGRVLHAITFLGFDLLDLPTTWGFAQVVTYVGSNVLLMTGDGAGATAAVWVPVQDTVVMVSGYNTVGTGNSRDSRVVLYQGDGPCATLVSITPDGSAEAISGLAQDPIVGCAASYAATFSPDGSIIASGGTEGEPGRPILLLTRSSDGSEAARIPIPDIRRQIPDSIHAIQWLDDHTVVVLADDEGQWGMHLCDTKRLSCDLAQPIAFIPTDFFQVALVVGRE